MRLPEATCAALALAFGLAACSGTERAADDSQENKIVGGVAAKSASLDAIGALGRRQADGSFKYFCTATLISPHLVLTAKHCSGSAGLPPTTESETIYFAVGENSKAPKRTVKLLRTWTAKLDEGGYVKRGADVAVMSLAESIDDITPLALADDHLEASFVGTRVSAVGYGVRDVARSSGERRAGTLTIRATEGAILQGVLPTVDEAIRFVQTEGGAAYDPARDEPRLRTLWDASLLPRHELFVGVAPGDAQPCSGDSGGPLVARIGDRLVVFAVVSGSFKLSNSLLNPCSVLGEVYATFPPDVQATIDEAAMATDDKPERVRPSKVYRGSTADVPSNDLADRCAGVPVAGKCSRGASLRCIAESEGPPRVTRTDCTLLLQTCRMVDGVAGAAGAAVAEPSAECVDP